MSKPRHLAVNRRELTPREVAEIRRGFAVECGFIDRCRMEETGGVWEPADDEDYLVGWAAAGVYLGVGANS